ncbi:MAG: YggS family pyridoxal phosphate-dependent enzyme [Candidatus Gastranaerophilales bacterium]|nr:YggS family pyridoxal phosphate-dependent enzyme [Candidatus Gastranaerophilales bacterium]
MTKGIVETNLLRLKQEIAPYKPRIIAVTKYYDINAILDAYNAGLRDFGESRANDAIGKITSLPEEIRRNSRFHFIGHLQTNKVDKVVRYFDYIQSADSSHLLRAISESAIKYRKEQKILLQVNISGEVQKFGFEERELFNLIPDIKSLNGISIEGLMCMAPLGADESTLIKIFSKAEMLLKNINNEYGLNLNELSMGMSDDYKCAVKCGATMIRIGRLLFSQ